MGRVGLADRLRARRDEIAQSLIARVWAVSDPHQTGGPDYGLGLREAVFAALDYGLATIAHHPQTEPVPAILVEQARAAARNGVGLDTVLRRYLAGHTLLCDHLVLEAERAPGVDDRELRRALHAQGAQLDRLLAAVTDAYTAEVADRQQTSEGRRAEQVRRLLDGDLVDPVELDYPLNGWHLAVVASGPCAPSAVRELAALLGRRSLVVLAGGETVWAWLGGRHSLSVDNVRIRGVSLLERFDGVAIAFGHPAEGVDGLRVTHRQARAAFAIATQAKGRVVDYADVALVAAAWQDEILARSLSELFLAPLASERDGGASLLKTLQAYYATGRNAASAASRLGITRQTVKSRLRTIEDHIGRSLDACGPEAQIALRLWELGHPTALTTISQYDQKRDSVCHIADESVARKD